MNSRPWRLLMTMLLCGLAAGCATAPYKYSRFADRDPAEAPDKVVFEYGKPCPVLDKMSWVVGLPTRILPFHPKVNSHCISPETAEKLERYLTENDLTDVLVRVNQYDPVGEFRRLKQNKRLAAGWRYTLGTANLIGYTLIPGRVFGGDMYNPYTNTLYVNSDVPAILIADAAFAKDVHSRDYPGIYTAISEVPVLTLWRLSNAVNDTLGYAQEQGDWELERETYRTVYPLMGIQAGLGGHTAATWVTALPQVTVPITMVGGAVVGHSIGLSTISRRERERGLGSQVAQEENDESKSGVRLIGFEEIETPN